MAIAGIIANPRRNVIRIVVRINLKRELNEIFFK